MNRIDMLNEEQRAALDKMLAWVKSPDKYFLLKGYAGTGKTFLTRAFADAIKGRLVFTAPTNKATRVLRDTLTDTEYKPECRTIYSLLGLSLQPNGEVKELTVPEDPIDLTHYVAVIVDEGSMVNNPVFKHIKLAAETTGVKFLFMGDPAQLPPVGEQRSDIWKIENSVELTKVMRYDNQILKLATALRQVVDHPVPQAKLVSDNANEEGIWVLPPADFMRSVLAEASMGGFSRPNFAKAIAWRNVRVDELNRAIRNVVFPGSAGTRWVVGDRVLFAAPANDLDDQKIASTDDEGTIEKVVEDWHPVYGEFKIWRMTVTLDDNRVVVARVLHEDYEQAFQRKLEDLAQAAKLEKRKWRFYWDLKDAFHQIRYGYAITAHRAQGSTYTNAYVDYRDVLLNKNRQEAFRCLYVACTRAKKALILG